MAQRLLKHLKLLAVRIRLMMVIPAGCLPVLVVKEHLRLVDGIGGVIACLLR